MREPLVWAPTLLVAGFAAGASAARLWLKQDSKLKFPSSSSALEHQENLPSESPLLDSKHKATFQGSSTPRVVGDQSLETGTETGASVDYDMESAPHTVDFEGNLVVYSGLLKPAEGGHHYESYSEYDGQRFYYPGPFGDQEYLGPMVPQSDAEALFEMAHESCMYEDDFWEAQGGLE